MATTDRGEILYTIKAEELKEHLVKRAAYHANRNAELIKEAEEKQKKMEEDVSGAKSTTDLMSIKSSSAYNAASHERDSALMRARNHAKISVKFNFLAEHISVGTTFDITLDGLTSLEFFPE